MLVPGGSQSVVTMPPTDKGSIETDRINSLLASSRRRCVLSMLADGDEVTVEKLARTIAARERNGTFDDDRRDRVVVSLVHNHLPRLADHGVVDYDRQDGTVSAGRSFAELEPFLERFRGSSAPLTPRM